MGVELTEEEQQQLSLMAAEDNAPPEVATEEVVEQAEEQADEQAAEQVAEQPEDERVKMVPHEAFHEEREKRKALRDQLEQERIKFAKLEERLNLLSEKFSPKEPEIDPDEDPLGYQASELQKLQQRTQQQDEQLRQLQLRQHLESTEREFSKASPDYYDALNHLQKTVVESIQDIGGSAEEGMQKYYVELNAVIQKAMQNGKNPAEMAYKMAKRYGFHSSLDDAKGQSADHLQKVAEGQAKSKSLSSGGGKVSAPLSAEALASMSDEEFFALDEKAFKAAFGA